MSPNHRSRSLLFLPVLVLHYFSCAPAPNRQASDPVPSQTQFEVDPFWPKPLPNKWILGQVAGVDVDSQDHVWIVNRPRTLTPREAAAAQDPPLSDCCLPAPSVIEFDPEGNVVQAWGGPSHHESWPQSEHGIFIDHQENVWIASNGTDDHVVLKFTGDGQFLLQIGHLGETGGSNDTERLGGPADIAVDPETNEVYVADGYRNRRVVVFDAETGAYKRHWGGYGETPEDGELLPYDPSASPSQSFGNPVHAVRLGTDGLVHVADRSNNRIQIFQKDGIFVKEKIIASQTLGSGSVWDIDFSPDATQSYLYVPDGTGQKVWVVRHSDLEVVGSFGRGGRYAGQFHYAHNVAADSQNNLFVTEVLTGKRVQKFRPTPQ